jgi:hypothetical protein
VTAEARDHAYTSEWHMPYGFGPYCTALCCCGWTGTPTPDPREASRQYAAHIAEVYR